MTAGATADPEVQALLRVLVAGRTVAEDAILALVEPGGILVKDDMTPGRPIDGDEVREFLLRDSRLAATEILVSPEIALIVPAKL